MMFWYSSKVTLLSSVFLRATFMLRFGVRACVVAASSAKALKKRIFCVSCAFTNFLCVFWQLVTTAAGRAKGYGPQKRCLLSSAGGLNLCGSGAKGARAEGGC